MCLVKLRPTTLLHRSHGGRSLREGQRRRQPASPWRRRRQPDNANGNRAVPAAHPQSHHRRATPSRPTTSVRSLPPAASAASAVGAPSRRCSGATRREALSRGSSTCLAGAARSRPARVRRLTLDGLQSADSHARLHRRRDVCAAARSDGQLMLRVQRRARQRACGVHQLRVRQHRRLLQQQQQKRRACRAAPYVHKLGAA
jgi:hypothetical protein